MLEEVVEEEEDKRPTVEGGEWKIQDPNVEDHRETSA